MAVSRDSISGFVTTPLRRASRNKRSWRSWPVEAVHSASAVTHQPRDRPLSSACRRAPVCERWCRIAATRRSRSAVSCARAASNPCSSSAAPCGRVPRSRSQHRRREAAVIAGSSRNAVVNCAAADPNSPSASSTSAQLKRCCAFLGSALMAARKHFRALLRLPSWMAAAPSAGQSVLPLECECWGRCMTCLAAHATARTEERWFCRVASGQGLSSNCSEPPACGGLCSIGRTGSGDYSVMQSRS